MSSSTSALTESAGRDSVASPGGAKVLIAEDNPINQRVAVIILSKLGYSTDVAADGAEVLQMLQQQHYDLVLMDCQMPVMDGFEATQAIRALKSDTSQIPIIAVTANALAGQREKCLASGMNDYISKPISTDLLASTIQKYLPPLNGDTPQRMPSGKASTR